MRFKNGLADANRNARRAGSAHRRLLPLLMLILTFTGCVSSPVVSTSHRAVNAATKNRLDKFRKQLSEEAKKTLGTPAEFSVVRQKLVSHANVSVADPLMISSKKGDQGYDHYGDVQRNYEANVSGSAEKDAPAELIFTLRVQCNLAYGVYHHDETAESCTTTIDQNNIPWTNCTPGTPAYDSIDLGESCKVTGIR